jgi:probable addiction module antidote protein
MTEKLYTYDPAEALDTPEAVAVFIADAMETGDAEFIAKALAVADKAKQPVRAAGKESRPAED